MKNETTQYTSVKLEQVESGNTELKNTFKFSHVLIPTHYLINNETPLPGTLLLVSDEIGNNPYIRMHQDVQGNNYRQVDLGGYVGAEMNNGIITIETTGFGKFQGKY